MNPLEIYKKLPRSNCGKCPALTCMSFAVRLSNKEITASECPALDNETKKQFDGMVREIRDWKERRAAELFNEISEVDFQAVAEGIGAAAEKDMLKIMYMGKKVSVTHSGFRNDPGILDRLLILMYIKKAGTGRLSGKWTAFRDLKNGLIRSNSFNEECEKALAKIYGRSGEDLVRRLKTIGAEHAGGQAADLSFILYPLPKIPFLVLLWSGDKDFEPDCRLLLDSTATDFLDVEALLYLGMALVRALR